MVHPSPTALHASFKSSLDHCLNGTVRAVRGKCSPCLFLGWPRRVEIGCENEHKIIYKSLRQNFQYYTGYRRLYNHITTKESLPWCWSATISASVHKVRRQIRMSEIPRTGYTVAAPNTAASGPQTICQCCRALLLSKCSVALTTLKCRSVWHPPICPRIRQSENKFVPLSIVSITLVAAS